MRGGEVEEVAIVGGKRGRMGGCLRRKREERSACYNNTLINLTESV